MISSVTLHNYFEPVIEDGKLVAGAIYALAEPTEIEFENRFIFQVMQWSWYALFDGDKCVDAITVICEKPTLEVCRLSEFIDGLFDE